MKLRIPVFSLLLTATVFLLGQISIESKALPIAGAWATGGVKGSFRSLERLKTKGDTSQRDLVIYLEEKVKTDHAAPSDPVKVKQERLVFKPHVLPVVKGTKVEFTNGDDVVHNVFAQDDCCKVDVDMPAGKVESQTFETLGVASIVCRLHPDMSMYVVVLENPYFTAVEIAKSDQEGDGGATYGTTYEIANVPPGDYSLTFWNKKLAPKKFDITIQAGETTTFDIEAGTP